MVVLLSFSMLIGTFYYFLLFLTMKTAAAETDDSSWNINMRIGICYDNKISVSVHITAENGFDVGFSLKERDAYSIDHIENTEINVARHVNLKYVETKNKDGSVKSRMYDTASSASETTVGSYHIEVISDQYKYKEDTALIKSAFPEYNVFPAFLYNAQNIFIGQFATEDEASAALSNIKSALNGESATSLPDQLKQAILNSTVRAPLNNDTVVIDTNSHNIVWLHGSPNESVLLALKASQNDPNNEIFMSCRHKYDSGETTRDYNGYLEFSHLSPEEYYGLVMVNIVRLEDYVVGVCAAEISTSWPMETLKAFSIAVRSYTVSNFNGHKNAFGADLCNEADCQVFNGYGPAVERVWRAVAETKGIIATSNGKLCGTYYSSSTGGCTANVTDVWGSSLSTYPYLKAVSTPWEKYTTYYRGQRTTTVTGTDLYNLLVSKKYTALKGPVTDVKITKTGNNTSYVTEIKFYDASGNCQTVTRADKIKGLLTNYVYSANFVVAKSGESVTRPIYNLVGFGAPITRIPEAVYVLGNPYLNKVLGHQQFSVMTSEGIKTFYDSASESIMTGTGLKDYDMSNALAEFPIVIGINGEILPDITDLDPVVESETLTTEAAANSFTFISRGWGHGVGMSQWGIYELGNLGYDYRYILKAYYTGITYTTYKEYLGV